MKQYSILLISVFLSTIGVILYLHSIRQNNNQYILTIGFGGDVMIGRMVNEYLKNTPPTYPWGNIIPLLTSTDFNLVNLETTLTTSTDIVSKVFNFKSDPKNVAVLKAGHISGVNLANNHVLDFDVSGLQETLQVLDAAGIFHTGAGMNNEQAKTPIIITIKGITIGIIGYTDNEPDWKAEQNKPGVNYIQVGDLSTVAHDVAQIRPQVDLLILSFHWGPNMRQRPSTEFQQFAHELIDAGVDIIHGHSAHLFQGIEIYKNRLILYDCGDFVDDYHVDEQLRNDQSLFYIVSVEKYRETTHIIRVRLEPLLIHNMHVNKAAGADRHMIFERIKQLSQELGTVVSNNGIISLETR